MARPLPSRGFTLIELMIVMALIALLAAAAVPALGGLTGATARKGAGELAGSMRWLFDSAAVQSVKSPGRGKTTCPPAPSSCSARPGVP